MSKKIFAKVFSKIRGAVSEGAEGVVSVAWKGMKNLPKEAPGMADEVIEGAIKKAKSGDADMKMVDNILEQKISQKVAYVRKQKEAIEDTFTKSGKVVEDIHHHINKDALKLLKNNPTQFISNDLEKAMYDKARGNVYGSLETDLIAANISLYGAKYKSVIEVEMNKAKSLQNRVEVLNRFHRSALNTKKVGLKGSIWEKANDEMTSARHKINVFYNKAYKEGNTPLANHLVMMDRAFEFGDIANTKLERMAKLVSKEISSYGDDGARKIEAYVKNADFTKTEALTNLGGGMSSGKRSIDRELAKKIGLTEEMVTTANKTVQKNRISAMVVQETENRSFNASRFLNLEADGVYIQSDLLANMSVPGKIGDLGANYTPLIPTKAYSEELKKINHTEWQMMDKHLSGDSHGFKTRRKWESDLSQNPDLRLGLAEATEQNTMSVARNASRTSQEKLVKEGADLEAIYGALLTSKGGMATSKADISASMERGASMFAPIWKEVQMLHSPKMKTRDTAIEKTFWGVMDLQKVVAIARPNQAALNALQPLVTNTAIPYSKILFEYAKQTPKFMKNFILGVSKFSDIDNVMRNHTKNLDPNSTIGYNIRRYFTEMGNANLSTGKIADTDQIAGFLGEGIGKKVSDFLTYTFKGSDLMARSVLFTASNSHFEKGMKKFGHLKGVDNNAFLVSMKKHLNLDAIHGQDIATSELMRKLLHSNIKEPAYLYSKMTTNHALFDYRPMAKPMFSKRGRASDAHSAATVFTSWGLYNSTVVKSYVQAASRGNIKPLLGLATMASIWYTGMSELVDSDNYFLKSFGRKGVSRTPGMAGITLGYDIISRPIGGMLVNPIASLTELFVKPMSKLNNDVSKTDKFDFLARELSKSQSPITGIVKEIGTVYEQF